MTPGAASLPSIHGSAQTRAMLDLSCQVCQARIKCSVVCDNGHLSLAVITGVRCPNDCGGSLSVQIKAEREL